MAFLGNADNDLLKSIQEGKEKLKEEKVKETPPEVPKIPAEEEMEDFVKCTTSQVYSVTYMYNGKLITKTFSPPDFTEYLPKEFAEKKAERGVLTIDSGG